MGLVHRVSIAGLAWYVKHHPWVAREGGPEGLGGKKGLGKFRYDSDISITKMMAISLTLLCRWLASWFLFALFLRWYFIFITVKSKTRCNKELPKR